MGRAKGQSGHDHQAPKRRGQPLPADVRAALSPEVARAWRKLQPILPDGLYLGGGTAAALRLGHRISRDLDFLFHEGAVDLDALERHLTAIGAVVTLRAPGTLRVLLDGVKVEFLHADEVHPQHRIAPPEPIAGVPVASAKDLMAMKLKVLTDRGELRDYFDVKELDERGEVSVEDGIAYFLERYGHDRASHVLQHLILALGYLDDVEEDDEVPMSKEDLAEWWRRRQAEVVRNLGP